MKRWIKNSLTIGLCLIPIGLIAGFSNSWSNKIPISCVGSSGVKPFVETLSQKYMKTQKNVDITIEAGGSGFGIQQIANGFANIGNASKDPYKAVQPDGKNGFRQEWQDRKIKTITIGWEAICMVYIPPKDLGINYDSDINLNNLLSISDDNIKDFMKIFTGLSDSNINNPTLWDFVNPSIKDQLSSNQQTKLKNTSITPYVRAGGSLTSGTASSFVGGSHLDFDEKRDLTSAQQAAFDSGQYGKNYGLVETDEANSRAWSIFKSANNPGQIVYLSSGFVNQNLDLIKKNGYGIMAYGNEGYDINTVDTEAGYNWFRPLNSMISLTKSQEPEINFIKALISDDAYKSLLLSNGAKTLSEKEMEFMFPGDPDLNNWISDYDLAKDKEADWFWPDLYSFSPTPDISDK